MFLVSLSCYNTASFQYHPHKAAAPHVDSGKSLVHADMLSSEMSLSCSDKGDLYTSASIIKFSAGRRVSQFGIKNDSRHILPERKTCFYMCKHWDALGRLEGLCISNVSTPPTIWTKTDVLQRELG